MVTGGRERSEEKGYGDPQRWHGGDKVLSSSLSV